LILCHSHSNDPPVNESSPFEKETTNWIELFPPLSISLELDYSFRFWDLYVEELSVFCLYSRTQVYQAVIAPGSRSKTIPFSRLCHQLATGFDIVIITGRPIREQWRSFESFLELLPKWTELSYRFGLRFITDIYFER
jgi:hypothetical protein